MKITRFVAIISILCTILCLMTACDRTPPIIETTEVTVFQPDVFDPQTMIKFSDDSGQVTLQAEGTENMEKDGVYSIKCVATDKAKNKTEQTVQVNVIGFTEEKEYDDIRSLVDTILKKTEYADKYNIKKGGIGNSDSFPSVYLKENFGYYPSFKHNSYPDMRISADVNLVVQAFTWSYSEPRIYDMFIRLACEYYDSNISNKFDTYIPYLVPDKAVIRSSAGELEIGVNYDIGESEYYLRGESHFDLNILDIEKFEEILKGDSPKITISGSMPHDDNAKVELTTEISLSEFENILSLYNDLSYYLPQKY